MKLYLKPTIWTFNAPFFVFILVVAELILHKVHTLWAPVRQSISTSEQATP